MKKLALLFSLFLLSLLSGCSTGRQSHSYSEVATSSFTSRSDSLLLRQMEQLNRNRTVQLEHIVFTTPDSSLAEPTIPANPIIQSITRITASEQAAQHTATSLDAGVASTNITHQEETTKLERKFSVSSGIYPWIVLFVFLLCFFLMQRNNL